MNYIECIAHIRKYKAYFKLEAIAKKININPDQFRQIVNRRQYAKELPEKYRADFIKVVTELTSVRQVEPYEGDRTTRAIALPNKYQLPISAPND